MSGKTISIGFVIEDGKDGLKKLTMDADALKKVMQGTLKETQTMKKSLIELGSVSFGFDAVSGALSSLQSVMGDLTKSYSVQIEAETKLETIMRQRMNATAAEIQSIKDLCSAQQELGVIGDEVQLAGAQQISTFLQTREALESLIPAMNNLVALQKGLNATSGDAVNIGNLLGKAMQGQTAALRRVGITFTEAEEKAVKYGTEQERAAALAKIITNNVGEMNAALAATPAGKIKQTENSLGDLKEKIGGVLKSMQPVVTTANQLFLAVSNFTKLKDVFVPLITNTYKWATAINGTTLAAKSLQIAVRGITFGLISAAAYGLIYLTQSLTSKTTELAKQQKLLNDIKKEALQQSDEEKNKIQLLINAAQNEKLSLDERQSAIKKLNSIIPEYNAYLDATTGKYNANKIALDNYLKSLVKQYEIEGAKEKLAEIGRKKADAMLKRSEAIKEHEKIKNSVKSNQKPGSAIQQAALNEGAGSLDPIVDAARMQSSYNRIVNATKDVNEAIAESNAILDVYGIDLQKNAVSTQAANSDFEKNLSKSKIDNKEQVIPAGSLADIEKQVSELEGKLKLQVDPQDMAEIQRQIDTLRQKEKEIRLEVVDIILKSDLMTDLRKKVRSMDLTLDVKVDADALQKELGKLPRLVNKTDDATDALQNNLKGVADVGRSAASAFSAMGDAMESPVLNVAAIIAGAIANVMAGFAAASAKKGGEGSPWEWIAFAISGLATAVAAVAQIKQVTAFASGGIVSGPTMALVGEYAGASNNPEVIAPLNKLRELLPDAGAGTQRIEVTGRLRGSDIELCMANRRRIGSASGRKNR